MNIKLDLKDIIYILILGLFFSILSGSVFASAVFIPFIIAIGATAFVFVSCRSKLSNSVIACIITGVVMTSISKNLDMAFISVFAYALTGFICTLCIKKKTSFAWLFLSLTISNLVYFLLLIYINIQKTGIKFYVFFEEFANKTASVYKEALSGYLASEETAEAAKMLIESLDGFSKYFLKTLPSMFFILSAATTFIFIIIVRSKFLKLPFGFVPDFRFWRVDKTFAYLYVITIFCALFVNSELYGTVFLNLELILSLIFIICGLSFAEYLLRSKNIPSVLSKIIVILLFVLSSVPVLSNLIGLLGFADALFNLRIIVDKKTFKA